MKLGAVERGSGATGKLKLLAASAVLRDRAPDVLRTMLARGCAPTSWSRARSVSRSEHALTGA